MPRFMPHVDTRWVAVGQDLIFLSLKANRFYTAPARTAGTLRAAFSGHEIEDAEALQSIAPVIEAGILVPWRGQVMDEPRLGAPTMSLHILNEMRPPPSAAGSALALGLRSAARLALALGSFPRIVHRLRAKRPSDILPSNVWIIASIAGAHHQTYGFSTTRDRCLSNSLALIWALGRKGVHARLVIGVRAMPFEAHSWVQMGDMILNDDLEAVMPFIPILVA